jgi:hypothetical protein
VTVATWSYNPGILALLLALTSPALISPVRCTTYEEKTLSRWHTVCDDDFGEL